MKFTPWKVLTGSEHVKVDHYRSQGGTLIFSHIHSVAKGVSKSAYKKLTKIFTSSPNCMTSSSVAMEILCITNIGSISLKQKKIAGVEKML